MQGQHTYINENVDAGLIIEGVVHEIARRGNKGLHLNGESNTRRSYVGKGQCGRETCVTKTSSLNIPASPTTGVA